MLPGPCRHSIPLHGELDVWNNLVLGVFLAWRELMKAPVQAVTVLKQDV